MSTRQFYGKFMEMKNFGKAQCRWLDLNPTADRILLKPDRFRFYLLRFLSLQDRLCVFNPQLRFSLFYCNPCQPASEILLLHVIEILITSQLTSLTMPPRESIDTCTRVVINSVNTSSIMLTSGIFTIINI